MNSYHTSSTQATNGQNVMGIVWAVPVRPDRLGYALSNFAAKMKLNYLPLTIFRRCAQKAGNPCAKISLEVVDMISDLVLSPDEDEDDEEDEEDDGDEDEKDIWLPGYICSQSACDDSHHVTKAVRDCFASEYDKEFGMDNFDYGDPFPWEEDPDWDAQNKYGSHDDEQDDDEEYTPAQQRFLDERATSANIIDRGGGTRVNDQHYKEEITDWIIDHDDFSSVKQHKVILNKWKKLFDQSPRGHFAKLDKVLEKFFGLEAYISITPINDSDKRWRKYSCQAYIHLPTKFASLNVVPVDLPGSDVSIYAHGAQIIRPEMLRKLSGDDKARFTKALTDLDLDVDVHPMSFSPKLDSRQKGKGPEDKEGAKQSRASTLEGMEWPMRIQVMKMRYDG